MLFNNKLYLNKLILHKCNNKSFKCNKLKNNKIVGIQTKEIRKFTLSKTIKWKALDQAEKIVFITIINPEKEILILNFLW